MHDWVLIDRSSHVAALSWEEVGEIPLLKGMINYSYGTLYVAYKNGKVYSYEGVSYADYIVIQDAESVGGALHRLGITNPMWRRQKLVGRFDPETGQAELSR